MESVKETQKRNCQDEPKEQNSRKSSNHTLFFFKKRENRTG